MDKISQSYGCNPRNPKGCIDQSQSLLREVRESESDSQSSDKYEPQTQWVSESETDSDSETAKGDTCF